MLRCAGDARVHHCSVCVRVCVCEFVLFARNSLLCMPLQPKTDGIVDFNSHEAIACYYCAAFNTITIIFLQYYLLKLRIIRNWIENIHK